MTSAILVGLRFFFCCCAGKSQMLGRRARAVGILAIENPPFIELANLLFSYHRLANLSPIRFCLYLLFAPPFLFSLSMMSSQLCVDDVVYGVGGAFHKHLGKITKVNPSKPAVEDGRGHRGCYWKENLARVGNVDSRFGFCSLCEKPSEFGKPCPRGGTGGKRCPGIIQGDLNWKLKRRSTIRTEVQQGVGIESVGVFLARQLGAALFRLGFQEVSDSIVDAVKQGLREASMVSHGSDPKLPSVLPPASVSNSAAFRD